ncbi:hypothetical protein [Clostridium botulinum]|uniref:hypothetical protein n=1 Tax=Clostridium botulinum TaxID=1491 RepID=UPI001C9B16DA|nr:hypothetical protein [Clostridium botulinum]MBY6842729.1 hypothetical protein [Clostridium botulinum]
MVSLIQKFKTTEPNQCILHTPEILDAIKQIFGETKYKALQNHESTFIEVSALLCDNPTKIEIRYSYDKPSLQQDLIEDCVFTHSESNIASIVATEPTSGTIYLTEK